ncbi:MAG: hypothetical protein JSR67_12925 [Proteobacteria bacterium]|nr:hypothetical protein [Pseudomonadota bacterium]
MDRTAALSAIRRIAGSLRPTERAELLRASTALAKPASREEHLALLEAQMAELTAGERRTAICERLQIKRSTYFRLRKKISASPT